MKKPGKARTTVFTTPQKMDKPPSSLSKERGVAEKAMYHGGRKNGGSRGASAKSVRDYAN